MPRLVLRKARLPAAGLNLAGPAAAQGVLTRRANTSVGGRRAEVMGERPGRVTFDSRIAAQDTPRAASDITRNLFTDPKMRRAWDVVVADLLAVAHQEVDLRAQLFRAVRAAGLEPIAGKTLLRRAVAFWRRQKNPP